MAKDEDLPNHHHIHRFIRKSKLDPESGNINYDAFILENFDGDICLSVDWVEHVCGLDLRGIGLLADLQRRLRELKPNSEAPMAIINVGYAKEYVFKEKNGDKTIDIRHWPTNRHDAHSRIYGSVENDEELAYILVDTVLRMFPVKDN